MKPTVTKPASIPAPLDGLNLVTASHLLGPTEARQLTNYLVYDTGIRETGKFTQVHQSGGSSSVYRMVAFDDGTATRMIYVKNNKVYKMASSTDAAPTDITGAAVITNSAGYTSVLFAQYIFLLNGTNPMLRYDKTGAAVALAAFAGPAGTDTALISGTGYKGRAYFIQGGSTSYWYGGLAAITGALTQVDLASVLETPSPLFACATWTFNQGLENQELFVVASEAGEILLYSGDNPGATNWGLIARGKTPALLTSQPFQKLGSQLYVTTTRGIIPLSEIFAGKENPISYSGVTRKIKDQINPFVNLQICYDLPFAATIAQNATSVYAMNYERGAWSELVPLNVATPTGGATFSTLCWMDSILMCGTTDGRIYRMNPTDALDANHFAVWRSPFMDFASAQLKSVKFAKIQGRNLTTGQSFRVRGGVETEFQPVANPPTAPTDSATGNSATAPNTCEVQLNMGNTGKRISPFAYRVGGTTGQNEIQGLDIYFEDGGYL